MLTSCGCVLHPRDRFIYTLSSFACTVLSFQFGASRVESLVKSPSCTSGQSQDEKIRPHLIQAKDTGDD